MNRFDEATHQVHDYKHLAKRWKAVARAAGLALETLATAGEYPIYCVRTGASFSHGLYLSAGIHGDEPAPVAGLLDWAEHHLPALTRAQFPLLILPCLNPWGLANNIRCDQRGHDLNRSFDRTRLTPVRELKKLLAGQRFTLAAMLHEDYDARGNYLYEVRGRLPAWGPELLEAASVAIPIDARRRIDGRPFLAGCAQRIANLRRVPLQPEALYLFRRHAPRVITFESPSEFALARRVRTHRLFIEACVRRVQKA
jgi:hypothetical protein